MGIGGCRVVRAVYHDTEGPSSPPTSGLPRFPSRSISLSLSATQAKVNQPIACPCLELQ